MIWNIRFDCEYHLRYTIPEDAQKESEVKIWLVISLSQRYYTQESAEAKIWLVIFSIATAIMRNEVALFFLSLRIRSQVQDAIPSHVQWIWSNKIYQMSI